MQNEIILHIIFAWNKTGPWSNDLVSTATVPFFPGIRQDHFVWQNQQKTFRASCRL